MANGVSGPLSPAGLGGAVGSRAPEQAIASSLGDAIAAARNGSRPALGTAFQTVSEQLQEVAAGLQNGTLKPDVVPKLREQIRKASVQLSMQQVNLPPALLAAMEALERQTSASGSGQPLSTDKPWNAQSPQDLAKKRAANIGALGATKALERLDRDDPNDPLVHRARSSGMSAEQRVLVQGSAVPPSAYVAKGDLDTLKQLVEQRTGNPDFVRQLGDELRALTKKTNTPEEALETTRVLRDLNITQLVTTDIKDSTLTVRYGEAVQKMLALLP